MTDDADNRAQESGTPERRRNGGLSDEQIDAIKEQIMASVYEDIGRSLVKKILWILGALLAALLGWLAAKGYVKL
jgi:hypothetical protein